MIFRRRLHRFTTAFVAVLSLLFAQLALASYACPVPADPDRMVMTMAAGEPFAGMDQAQPALCHQHAAGTAQSVEVVKLPAVSPPAVVQVLELPPVLHASESVELILAATAEARPPPDPLFLTTLRLRV